MKFQIGRHSIKIIPEDELDEAYIEDVLHLNDADDYVKLVRHNKTGSDFQLGWLETEGKYDYLVGED